MDKQEIIEQFEKLQKENYDALMTKDAANYNLDELKGREYAYCQAKSLFNQFDGFEEKLKFGGDNSGCDELIMRLGHLAGCLEAKDKIKIHNWDDLEECINEAINVYYDGCEKYLIQPSNEVLDKFAKNPFVIEDIAEEIFLRKLKVIKE